MNGEGVQGGLGSVVGEGLGVVNTGVGVGVQGERAENAGQVHNAPCRAFFDEGKQLLGQCDRGEEICFEDTTKDFERDFASAVFRAYWREATRRHTCVVDEDVETAEVRFEVLVSVIDVGGVGDVEFEEVGVNSGRAKFFDCLPALLRVASADDDLHIGILTEIECGLESDTAVCTGDECYFLRHA